MMTQFSFCGELSIHCEMFCKYFGIFIFVIINDTLNWYFVIQCGDILTYLIVP